MVVSLKGGDIYILTLVPDGMRGIRNIIFEKAASGVITSCVSDSDIVCVQPLLFKYGRILYTLVVLIAVERHHQIRTVIIELRVQMFTG